MPEICHDNEDELIGLSDRLRALIYNTELVDDLMPIVGEAARGLGVDPGTAGRDLGSMEGWRTCANDRPRHPLRSWQRSDASGRSPAAYDPSLRRRTALRLPLAGREEISRGIAVGEFAWVDRGED